MLPPGLRPRGHLELVIWCFFFGGGGTSSRATLSPLPGSGARRSERKGTGAGHLPGAAQHIHVPKSSPGESRWPRAPMLTVVAESPFALGIWRLKWGQGDGAVMRRGEASGNTCTASPCPGAAGGARWVPVTRRGWVLAQFGGVCALASPELPGRGMQEAEPRAPEAVGDPEQTPVLLLPLQ